MYLRLSEKYFNELLRLKLSKNKVSLFISKNQVCAPSEILSINVSLFFLSTFMGEMVLIV